MNKIATLDTMEDLLGTLFAALSDIVDSKRTGGHPEEAVRPIIKMWLVNVAGFGDYDPCILLAEEIVYAAWHMGR